MVVSTQQVFLGRQLRFCTLSSETLREDAGGPTGSFAESRPQLRTGLLEGGEARRVGRCPSNQRTVFIQHLVRAGAELGAGHTQRARQTRRLPPGDPHAGGIELGGGLRACRAVELLRRGLWGGWRWSGQERLRWGSGRGWRLWSFRASGGQTGQVGTAHGRCGGPGVPLGVDGQQNLGRVPLAPRWRRVGSGPSARQVRPSSAGSLVSALRVSPVKGQELPRQRGPCTRECLRAGPCGGLCGKAGRQEAGPGLSVRLRCLPWPAAAPPEPPLSSEPWGWGSLPTPPRPRVMPPSTPLASPPAAHPGGTSRRVSGRVVLRWLQLGTLLTAPWGPACWRSCPWLSGGRGAPGLAAPGSRSAKGAGAWDRSGRLWHPPAEPHGPFSDAKA